MLSFTQVFTFQKLKKLAFCLPHVCILGTHHCGNTGHEAFKFCAYFWYVLFCSDYVECVVTIFAHQILSEYYRGNISVSIEGIALENFSVSTQINDFLYHNHSYVILCFTPFCLMTVNRILKLQFHT